MLISALYGNAPSRNRKRKGHKNRRKKAIHPVTVEDIREPSPLEHSIVPLYHRDGYKH